MHESECVVLSANGKVPEEAGQIDALEVRSTKTDDSRTINELGRSISVLLHRTHRRTHTELCVVMRTMIEIAHARTAGVLQTGTIEGQGVSSQSETYDARARSRGHAYAHMHS